MLQFFNLGADRFTQRFQPNPGFVGQGVALDRLLGGLLRIRAGQLFAQQLLGLLGHRIAQFAR